MSSGRSRPQPGPLPEPSRDLPYLLLRITARPFGDLAALVASRAVRALDRRTALLADTDAEAEALVQALFEKAGPPDPQAGPEAARARLAAVALKRAVHNRRRLDPEQVETAAPRLGADLRDRLQAFDTRLATIEDLSDRFETVFAADLLATRRALLEAVREPGFAAAIRLASRPLLTGLRRLPDPETWRHGERHTAATLAAYRIRAATKTSPNGLFCATAPAGWAVEESDRGGAPGTQGENRLRLDGLLHVVEARKVAACLGSDPEVWPVLVPRVNPTLIEEDGAWVFWRPASLAREDDHEIRRRVTRHPVAEVFLAKAHEAELSASELIAAVAESTGLPESDLAGFFARLADAGLLSREIEIPYTCRRPLAYLAEQVRGSDVRPAWLPEIEAIEHGVAELAELPPEPRIDAMDRLTARLDALPHTRPLATDELFRIDAASGISATLPATILDDLQSTLSCWARLFGAVHPRPLLRRSLARRFVDEHGADREVPFLEVYRKYEGASKIAPDKDPRLVLPPPPPGDTPVEREARRAFDRARSFFADKAREAEAAGTEEVALTETDWRHLLDDAPEPPWTAGAVFQVAARRPDDLAAGRYRLTLNDLFTGFGVALARFAHLHHGHLSQEDNPILQELARAAERFRRPGAVLAEITYNHWGRAANAGLRIPFLKHEIELPGERVSPGATAIPLPELTLRWDSEDERLALTWHRPDAPEKTVEVVPVISSGLSPEGIVALLVGIGRQAIQPLAYFPGFDVEGVTRWPRFVHGRVVLFRRRWVLAPGSYPEPPTEALDPDLLLGRFFAEVHAWRLREDLPRHVFVCTDRAAKPFAVDLESPLAVDLLRRLLTPADGQPPPELHVTEMLPGPEDLWVRDARGAYATEFLTQRSGG